MLPAEQADAIISSLVTPLGDADRETVPLWEAQGRVLAASVISPLDIPHWDNSAMDGYAVRYDDVRAAIAASPQPLQVIEEIPAGYAPQQAIASGQAARIFTGGMLPEGADTIVIQENTQRQGEQVLVLAAPDPKAFVRHRGAFHRAGESLLPPGIALGAADIAVLAAAQCPQVQVYRRPRVAILSTGNELVTPEQPLQPGQIVDSNQYALAALVSSAGATPIPLGIVADTPEALKQAIAQACAQADVVLSTGGVSVGDYDYVDQILAELGAEIHVRAVAVKPGKPLTVATLQGGQSLPQASGSPVLYFGLPGNPVSSLVSFWRFVQPALRQLSGRSAGWGPTFLPARATQALSAGGQRETYLWGRLEATTDGYGFQLSSGSHSSGNLVNLSQTNALARVPRGETRVEAGSLVRVMLVGEV